MPEMELLLRDAKVCRHWFARADEIPVELALTGL
jgi:hypothetical protein